MLTTTVPHSDDFALDGALTHPAWEASPWLPLTPCDGGPGFATRARMLWSDTGIYAAFDGEAGRLTCTLDEDNVDLYREDVFEWFLWPEESQIAYFEYEISPRGKHLPIMVNNDGQGAFYGWLPWHLEGPRAIRRAVAVRGGEAHSGARVSGWSAAVFLPFALFRGLRRCPPQRGEAWRGNCYRIDHDTGHDRHYAWSPVTAFNFHHYHEFGRFIFA
jgi:hypothetical protein